MKRSLLTASALALAIAGTGAALAQTAPAGNPAQGPAAGTPALTAERSEIRTRPAALFDVPNVTPQEVDLNLVAVPGAGPELTQGVTAKGFARYVEVEGQRIGQVILVGVERDGRREALPANSFNAQFELQSTQVDPTTDITIEGDAPALVAALERLAEEPAAEEVVDQEAVENDTSAPPGGSDRPGNDMASGYETPERLPATPDPVETVRLTTQGCPIRVDIDGMAAIQQSRVETVVDGVVSDEGQCADGAEQYPLARSYTGCDDVIDLDARTATAQYELFYVDAGASRVEVAECQPDPEKVFEIVERQDACPIFLDYTNEQAVPQASLVYADENNVEVQVRGCAASETRPAVPMVQTTNGCSIRHDMAGGVSHRQSVWAYELDGIVYQAGGCRDDGTVYPHETVYDDAGGQLVCAPIVDQAAGTVTLQSRVRITVDGLSQFITDCRPDASSSLAIQATTDGCTNLATWEHDLVAGVSYGQERFFYERGGSRTYVSECQRSDATYAHQVEATGWQHNDATRTSLPLNTVFIDGPSGRYDVAVNTILPGAIEQPYVLEDTRDVLTGELDDGGQDTCDVYRLTARSEIYERPDGTEFARHIGPGDPIGPENACSQVIQQPVWSVVGSSQSCSVIFHSENCDYNPDGGHTTCTTRYQTQNVRHCDYAGERVLVRDDGAQIAQTSSNTNRHTLVGSGRYVGASNHGGICSQFPPPAAPPCPSTYTDGNVYSWNQAEGW